MRPFPIPNFREVVPVLANVASMLYQLISHELLEMSADALQARHAVDDIPCEVKSIQIV
jgi:hypothetical protein